MLFRVELIICQGPASVAFSKRHVLAPRVVAFNSAVRDRVAPEREREREYHALLLRKLKSTSPVGARAGGGDFWVSQALKQMMQFAEGLFSFLRGGDCD